MPQARLDVAGDLRVAGVITGRFRQPDTVVPDPSNPQALNRYAYCLNDPGSRVDPSGHESVTYGSVRLVLGGTDSNGVNHEDVSPAQIAANRWRGYVGWDIGSVHGGGPKPDGADPAAFWATFQATAIGRNLQSDAGLSGLYGAMHAAGAVSNAAGPSSTSQAAPLGYRRGPPVRHMPIRFSPPRGPLLRPRRAGARGGSPMG